MYEWVKYSPYGIPFGMPAADTESDGDCDATDITQIQTWINGSAYDVRGDLDLDGDVDTTDKSTAEAPGTVTLGWRVLSSVSVLNWRGFGGGERDVCISERWYFRFRSLDVSLGRWSSRDVLEYVEGMSLYESLGSAPIGSIDPLGLYCPINQDSGLIDVGGIGVPKRYVDPANFIREHFQMKRQIVSLLLGENSPAEQQFVSHLTIGTLISLRAIAAKATELAEKAMVEFRGGPAAAPLIKYSRSLYEAASQNPDPEWRKILHKMALHASQQTKDALVHCIGACLGVQSGRGAITGPTGLAHEVLGYNHPFDNLMDLYNNRQGEHCGNSGRDCYECCLGKLRRNRLCVWWVSWDLIDLGWVATGTPWGPWRLTLSGTVAPGTH